MGKSLISKVREGVSKILVMGLTGSLPYVAGCISLKIIPAINQLSISTAGEWSDFNNNKKVESFEVSNLGKKIFYPGEKIGVYANTDIPQAKEMDVEKIVELEVFDEEKQTYLPHSRDYQKTPWEQYFPIEIKEEDQQKGLKGRLTLIVSRGDTYAIGHTLIKKVLTADFLYNPPPPRQTPIPQQTISP